MPASDTSATASPAAHPLDELARPRRLVVLVIRDERRLHAEAVEQHARAPRVLAGDDVGVAQRRQRAQRDVLEVADRRRARRPGARSPRRPLPAPASRRRSSRRPRRARRPRSAPRRRGLERTLARDALGRLEQQRRRHPRRGPPPITTTSGSSRLSRLASPTPSFSPMRCERLVRARVAGARRVDHVGRRSARRCSASMRPRL